MKALERIKEIERNLISDALHMSEYHMRDPIFLMKAFRVMREVAIQESYAMGEMCATRKESAEVIDEEFEERMNKSNNEKGEFLK